MTIKLFLAATLLSLSGAAQASSLSAAACVQYLFPENCDSTTDSSLVSQHEGADGVYGGVPWSWEYAVAAQAKSFGELGVFATLKEFRGGYIPFLLPTYNRDLFARAVISDTIFVDAISAGTLSFVFDVEGSASFDLDDGAAGVRLTSPQFGNHSLWGANSLGDYSPLVESVLLSSPFSGGRLAYSLTMEANFYCSYFYGAYCTGTAVADFLNTATLTQVLVYDSSGNLIANPSLRFESGFVLPEDEPVSGVPEPSTYALFITGIAALWLKRRA